MTMLMGGQVCLVHDFNCQMINRATGHLGLSLAIRLVWLSASVLACHRRLFPVCPWLTGGLSEVGPVQVLASLSLDCVSGEASGSFVPEWRENRPVTLAGAGRGELVPAHLSRVPGARGPHGSRSPSPNPRQPQGPSYLSLFAAFSFTETWTTMGKISMACSARTLSSWTSRRAWVFFSMRNSTAGRVVTQQWPPDTSVSWMMSPLWLEASYSSWLKYSESDSGQAGHTPSCVGS